MHNPVFLIPLVTSNQLWPVTRCNAFPFSSPQVSSFGGEATSVVRVQMVACHGNGGAQEWVHTKQGRRSTIRSMIQITLVPS